MTIAKYIRLSLEDGKSESQSIDNQRLLLDAHIQSMDLSNVEVLEFVDNGYSGTNFDRPAIQSLLALVQERKIDCIIVKDFSRFGRNALETGYYLERIFPLYGVRFLSLADSYDSQAYGEDTGGLLVSFKFLMAEYYSKDLSQKITSAARERMKRGERISKRCTFGYRKEGNNLVPDETTAPTVQRIFQLAENGASVKTIIQTLYQEQHLIPSVCRGERKKDEYSYFWTTSAISSILRNQQYTGTYVAGQTKVEGFGSKKRVPVSCDKWIIIPHHHEALISQETFDCVQLKLRKKVTRQPVVSEESVLATSPLDGIVYCGSCGHRMYLSKGSSPSFSCSFTRHINDAKCHKLRISAEELELQVHESIMQWARAITETASTHNSNTSEKSDCPDLKQKELYEDFVNGILTIQQYQAEKAKMTKAPPSTHCSTFAKKREHSLPMLANHILNQTQLTTQIVQKLIEKVLVHSTKEVEILWNEVESSDFTENNV